MNVGFPARVAVSGALFLAALMVPLETLAQSQNCPPARAKAGPAKPVPGKEGETGWLLSEEVDQAGNKLQTWCLQPRAGKHQGPDFGSLWKPKGSKDEDAVWIGACTFPNGRNQPNKTFKDKNGEGIPDQFTKLTWFNAQKPPGGTNDWDYSFDPATGKLTVKKTTGTYMAVHDPQTGRLDGYLYKDIKVIDTDTYDAPKDFSGLHFKDTQISYLGGQDAVAAEAFAAVFETVSPSGVWTYGLRVNDQGGSGTDSDPFVGALATSLVAGDTFSIAAAGVQNPFVSGLAAMSEYGGWVVDSFTQNSVSFRATADADFIAGTLIDGFGFYSNAVSAALNPWDLASSNEQIGSSGSVLGPSQATKCKIECVAGGS